MNLNERNLKAVADVLKTLETAHRELQKQVNAMSETNAMLVNRVGELERQALVQRISLRGTGPTSKG
jgi:DNA-binding HxlR family transcriptional regulator